MGRLPSSCIICCHCNVAGTSAHEFGGAQSKNKTGQRSQREDARGVMWGGVRRLLSPLPQANDSVTMVTVARRVSKTKEHTQRQKQDREGATVAQKRTRTKGKLGHSWYSLFRSIVLSLLIQTYPRRVSNYSRIICTTGPFIPLVYSHARTCKHLSDLSVI